MRPVHPDAVVSGRSPEPEAQVVRPSYSRQSETRVAIQQCGCCANRPQRRCHSRTKRLISCKASTSACHILCRSPMELNPFAHYTHDHRGWGLANIQSRYRYACIHHNVLPFQRRNSSTCCYPASPLADYAASCTDAHIDYVVGRLGGRPQRRTDPCRSGSSVRGCPDVRLDVGLLLS